MDENGKMRIHLDWGARGTQAAADRGDLIVVVDVLSFSSTVTTAVYHGAEIIPSPYHDREAGRRLAEEKAADFLYGRAESASGGPTLSPVSFLEKTLAGKRFVLVSKNGALCASIAGRGAELLLGCFNNLTAVSERIASTGKKGVTVIAAGETWEANATQNVQLRPAIEDYLCAGAIISKLSGVKTAEAKVGEAAYLSMSWDIPELLSESESGQELIGRGFETDVHHAGRIDLYPAVPELSEGEFINRYQFKETPLVKSSKRGTRG